MDAEIERSLTGDSDLLGAEIGEGEPERSCGLRQKLDVEAKWVFLFSAAPWLDGWLSTPAPLIAYQQAGGIAVQTLWPGWIDYEQLPNFKTRSPFRDSARTLIILWFVPCEPQSVSHSPHWRFS